MTKEDTGRFVPYANVTREKVQDYLSVIIAAREGEHKNNN